MIKSCVRLVTNSGSGCCMCVVRLRSSLCVAYSLPPLCCSKKVENCSTHVYFIPYGALEKCKEKVMRKKVGREKENEATLRKRDRARRVQCILCYLCTAHPSARLCSFSYHCMMHYTILGYIGWRSLLRRFCCVFVVCFFYSFPVFCVIHILPSSDIK